jgi:hypothetical protein
MLGRLAHECAHLPLISLIIALVGCGQVAEAPPNADSSSPVNDPTTSTTGDPGRTDDGPTNPAETGDASSATGSPEVTPETCGEDIDCDDDIDCTTDTCDPDEGCAHTAEDSECDDGLACTADTCDVMLGCQTLADDSLCDDSVDCTADRCEAELGCVSTPEDSQCDDADLCTNDMCTETGCSYTPGALSCDDGIDCTSDTCDAALGCLATPQDAVCDDGNACSTDTCDATLGCASVPISGPCDDEDPCTEGDQCQGNSCTGALVEGCFYAEPPDLPSCNPGVLSPARTLQALNDLNQIRALSGLAPVTYDTAGDPLTQGAALVMVANSSLSHEPPQSWACWSQAAADGAISSNLFIQWQWEPNHFIPWESMVGWLIDDGVVSLGHRRWMLDPFLSKISYGAVHGTPQIPDPPYPAAFASSLQVVHDAQADLSDTDLSWVAYPVGEYPAELFGAEWYLSFSWLVDPMNRYANSQVDLSEVVVTVTDSGGAPLPVLDVSTDNDWMGLPNNVQWRVDDLVEGLTYTVTISGGSYGDEALETAYTLTLL